MRALDTERFCVRANSGKPERSPFFVSFFRGLQHHSPKVTGEIGVHQGKSENYTEFSQRTEALAEALSLRLSDLPDRIGVSPSMFYAYRTGKHHISDKAWRKLEAAELGAGIFHHPDPGEGSSDPEQSRKAEFVQRIVESILTAMDQAPKPTKTSIQAASASEWRRILGEAMGRKLQYSDLQRPLQEILEEIAVYASREAPEVTPERPPPVRELSSLSKPDTAPRQNTIPKQEGYTK